MMRMDRVKRIEELVEHLRNSGVEDPYDPRIPDLVRSYLKTKYGFSDTTIRDYIETVIMKLREG